MENSYIESQLDIRTIKKDIVAEAEKRKQAPKFHNRESLPKKKIKLVPKKTSWLKRFMEILLREKLGAIRHFYHFPVIGYWFKFIFLFVRMPTRFGQIYSSLKGVTFHIEKVELKLLRLENQLKSSMEKIAGFEREFEQELAELRDMNSRVDKRLLELNSLQDSPVDNDSSKSKPSPHGHGDIMHYNDFYESLEDRFRGSNIQEKLAGYLEFFDGSPFDYSREKILDIGCGRGEWLSLLRENSFQCVGIDINDKMIGKLKRDGFEAYSSGALEFLRSQEEKSFAAITAFHVVEHMPADVLLDMLREIKRVLKKQGVLILETPNPENILVGSCNFYTDPSHINPIPPHTLDFMVEYSGFSERQIKRVSPPNKQLKYKDPYVQKALDWFNKEQDYSVIAIG